LQNKKNTLKTEKRDKNKKKNIKKVFFNICGTQCLQSVEGGDMGIID